MSVVLGKDLSQGVLVIAELSANACGRLDLARELVCAAAQAGADAVKMQVFYADDMCVDDDRVVCPAGPWKGRKLYDLYRECATPREWFPILRDEAAKAGIPLFTSVFNPADIPYLEAEGCPAYKVAASEAHWQELVDALEDTGKPVLISGRPMPLGYGIYPLEVVAEYPAQPEQYTLRGFGGDGDYEGISDHTAGIELAPLAVAAGARIVEKHLRLSHGPVPPDVAFSLVPSGFDRMVQEIRRVERILHGTGKPRDPVPYARSLWVTKPVNAGDRFTTENVRVLRPAGGLAPDRLPDVLGRKAAVDLAGNQPLEDEHLE